MPTHHDDELPSLEAAELATVTGGAGFEMSTMLPLMLMLRSRSRAATPPPMPAPTWKPKVMVDGVEQQPDAASANGTSFTTST